MPETVHPYRAEVEQFRFVCYRTKGVFHRMDRLLRRVAALLDGLHFTTTPQALGGSPGSSKMAAAPLLAATLLRPEYLSQKLDRPLPTKDGGILRTIRDACDYMTSMDKKRELRSRWQRACKLILAKEDVLTVSKGA